jgi:SAM-dependent methyltransferase
MGGSPITPPPAPTGPINPRQGPLGEIRVQPGEVRPLGGLNPYSPHFDRIGNQFRQLLISHTGLHKASRVLDVGMGTGRLAKALLGELEGGEYHGFDVNKHFVDYCHQTYKAKNFHFNLSDVRHDEYNPVGSIDPTTFEFPYPNHAFDLVVMIAVLNHFRASWFVQYIQQAARVLKPRGTFFGTCLFLNPQSITHIGTRVQQPYLFPFRTPESWHDFEDRPLFNVAHPEEHIRRVFIKNKLAIKEPIRYGEWCHSKIAITGPDVILARKGGWL